MLSQKQQLQLELYCQKYVLGMLSIALNPKYRGGNFTWEEWAEEVAQTAEAGVLTTHVQKKTLNEAKKYVYARCLAIANKTLTLSGLVVTESVEVDSVEDALLEVGAPIIISNEENIT